MKKTLLVIALLGIALIAWTISGAWILRKSHPTAHAASTLGKCLSAWALDNGGRYPDDLWEFAGITERYGMDGELWKNIEVLEYHGGLSNSDSGRTLLLKMRLRTEPESVAELTTGGAVRSAALMTKGL